MKESGSLRFQAHLDFPFRKLNAPYMVCCKTFVNNGLRRLARVCPTCIGLPKFSEQIGEVRWLSRDVSASIAIKRFRGVNRIGSICADLK